MVGHFERVILRSEGELYLCRHLAPPILQSRSVGSQFGSRYFVIFDTDSRSCLLFRTNSIFLSVSYYSYYAVSSSSLLVSDYRRNYAICFHQFVLLFVGHIAGSWWSEFLHFSTPGTGLALPSTISTAAFALLCTPWSDWIFCRWACGSEKSCRPIDPCHAAGKSEW